MTMDDSELERLARVRTIDLTTYGRRSGRPARIEIWWFRVDERFVITGTPGRRDWYANVLSNPAVIVHVNDADYPAAAIPITDRQFRQSVFTHPEISWYASQSELAELVASAPMIEIGFPTGGTASQPML